MTKKSSSTVSVNVTVLGDTRNTKQDRGHLKKIRRNSDKNQKLQKFIKEMEIEKNYGGYDIKELLYN